MLGDLINATGAVAALAEKFPSTTFILEGGVAAPELGFPVSEVWTRPRGGGILERGRRILAYRARNFDAAIVLDDGHTHARLARLAGIKEVYGIHRGKPELFAESVPFEAEAHDVFGQLDRLLALFGLGDADLRPRVVVDEREGQRVFQELGEPEVLVHTGASDERKTWPDERWLELLQSVPRPAVVGSIPGFPSIERMPIPVYGALLKRCRVLVTPDTGPAHLAAAVGTPTVVIYGPTQPSRFHPWPNGNQILLSEDRGCRHYGAGCAHLLDGACTHHCILSIEAPAVVGAVETLFLQCGTSQDGGSS